jgi:heme/copper-type cytochrome/quinol oxidase subunit 2
VVIVWVKAEENLPSASPCLTTVAASEAEGMTEEGVTMETDTVAVCDEARRLADVLVVVVVLVVVLVVVVVVVVVACVVVAFKKTTEMASRVSAGYVALSVDSVAVCDA